MSIVKINLAARLKEAETVGGKLDEKERTDRMKLSEDAKVLFAAEKAKRLGLIRAKIKTHFYLRTEVKEKVVEGLLRDLQYLHA